MIKMKYNIWKIRLKRETRNIYCKIIAFLCINAFKKMSLSKLWRINFRNAQILFDFIFSKIEGK